MNTSLLAFSVIISLMIGIPTGVFVAKMVMRMRWDRNLKMYRKTKNPRYLR